MDNSSFLYTFDDLPAHPSIAQVRRKLKRGARRQHAFKYLSEQHPNTIEYRLGYVESYAENGVYDDKQYQHCYDWIEQSFSLPDSNGTHARLQGLLADLRLQQKNMHAEFGPDPEVDLDPFEAALRARRYDTIESEFASLQRSVTPQGILGGDDEKRMWRLFQMMILIAFRKEDPDLAIKRLTQYEQQRIAVKLTPIPTSGLQEQIVGYLANQSLGVAHARLAYWIANSRMPIISDTIKQHDAFRDLFVKED